MNKIKFIFAFTLFLSMALVSCKQEYDGVFNQNATERSEAYLSDLKEILVSAPEGWVMDYYLGTNRSNGCYAFLMKFTDTKVTACSELHTDELESYYRLTFDAGAVLSFDTYNTVLHLLATPSAEAYQGKMADFEFLVINASKDEILLKGKRSENYIRMRPLQQDAPTYLSELIKLKEEMIVGFGDGSINGEEVKAELDLDKQMITLYSPTEAFKSFTTSFAFTTTGFRLYEPFVMKDMSMTDFTYTHETETLTSTASNGAELKMACSKPAYWRPFDSFVGKYDLTMKYKDEKNEEVYETIENVELTIDESGDAYLLKGASNAFDIKFGYSRSRGSLTLFKQDIATVENVLLRLCILDNKGYSLSWAEEPGMYLTVDVNSNDQEYLFTTNNYEDFISGGVLIWVFQDGDAYNGNDVRSWLQGHKEWLFVNGQYVLDGLYKLTRK